MANPDGKIKFSSTIASLESVEQDSAKQSSKWADVFIPSTLSYNAQNLYETDSIVWNDAGGTSHGYKNGTRYLAQVTTTSTNILSTGITHVEFVYFKHTGYRFNTFTDATCDTNDTAGSGSTFGSNPRIIQIDNAALIAENQVVSGTGITGNANVTQIDSSTLFRIDADVASDQTNTTLTFIDYEGVTVENTTDYLEIRGDSASGWIVALLAPGESVCLPIHCTSGRAGAWGASNTVASDDYYFQSVAIADLAAGGNDIAMEFICVAAS